MIEIQPTRFYLSSPGSQMHCVYLEGMPVLISFAIYPKGRKQSPPWMDSYVPSFGRLLVDSGAFSVMNTKKKVEGEAYRDWWKKWESSADAIAGLDSIEGDWRLSLRNYEQYGGFPTIHDTDPPELLDDLISIARAQGRNWIGMGLKPPRNGKEQWVRETLERMPSDLHVHGWALKLYSHLPRFDSFDSTEWVRTAWAVKKDYPWMTQAECTEIVVKKYRRWQRNPLSMVYPAAEEEPDCGIYEESDSEDGVPVRGD